MSERELEETAKERIAPPPSPSFEITATDQALFFASRGTASAASAALEAGSLNTDSAKLYQGIGAEVVAAAAAQQARKPNGSAPAAAPGGELPTPRPTTAPGHAPGTPEAPPPRPRTAEAPPAPPRAGDTPAVPAVPKDASTSPSSGVERHWPKPITPLKDRLSTPPENGTSEPQKRETGTLQELLSNWGQRNLVAPPREAQLSTPMDNQKPLKQPK